MTIISTSVIDAMAIDENLFKAIFMVQNVFASQIVSEMTYNADKFLYMLQTITSPSYMTSNLVVGIFFFFLQDFLIKYDYVKNIDSPCDEVLQIFFSNSHVWNTPFFNRVKSKAVYPSNIASRLKYHVTSQDPHSQRKLCLQSSGEFY